MSQEKSQFQKIGPVEIRKIGLRILVGNLFGAAAEFFIKIVAAGNHDNSRVIIDDFVGDSVSRAAGVKFVNKKSAERAVERFANIEIATQLVKAFFSFFEGSVGKLSKIFKSGGIEKYFSHNLAPRNNIFKCLELAGSEKFSSFAGSLFNLFNNGGVPENILAHRAPQLPNLVFQFLNSALSVYGHKIILYYNR